MNIPSNLAYTSDHEWIKNENGVAVIGITDHAQEELTDVVYAELPEIGQELSPGEACAVVESVKAASDIFAPVGGEVIEVNEALEDDPSLVNSSPYDQGWILKMKLRDTTELEELLTPEAYQNLIGQ